MTDPQKPEAASATPNKRSASVPAPALSPREALAYEALLRGPQTLRELKAMTGVPRRTLHTILTHLRAKGVLATAVNLMDTRQTYHWIRGTMEEKRRAIRIVRSGDV